MSRPDPDRYCLYRMYRMCRMLRFAATCDGIQHPRQEDVAAAAAEPQHTRHGRVAPPAAVRAVRERPQASVPALRVPAPAPAPGCGGAGMPAAAAAEQSAGRVAPVATSTQHLPPGLR